MVAISFSILSVIRAVTIVRFSDYQHTLIGRPCRIITAYPRQPFTRIDSVQLVIILRRNQICIHGQQTAVKFQRRVKESLYLGYGVHKTGNTFHGGKGLLRRSAVGKHFPHGVKISGDNCALRFQKTVFYSSVGDSIARPLHVMGSGCLRLPAYALHNFAGNEKKPHPAKRVSAENHGSV